MNKVIIFIKKARSVLSNHILLWVLLGILGVLFYQNYTPGTWLTGWDNLHPEFNFGLNIKRAFHSVWQEYQGLGLLAGMAHAADLLREIFLWMVSLVIPQSLNRYFYHFLMIASGAVGMYFFLKNTAFSKKTESRYSIASFLGALFYVFNLGSIQYFYVPFEPYSTFWGMLPWLLYSLFSYLKHHSKRNLLLFGIVNMLAIGQAYVQTIFLVYVMIVGLILLVYLIALRSKKAFVASLSVASVILIVNAFWILPQVYFVTQDIHVTQNSMQNLMATEKFFQMNKVRGTITDFMVLKEFYYDFLDTDQGQTVYMMRVWRDYFGNPIVLSLGYLFFGIIILGLIQKNPLRKYFVVMFLLSAFLFLSNTFGVEQLNNFLRNLPLVNQIFRNPFTKAIVPTSFIFAVGFALGIAYLLTLTKRVKFANYFILSGFMILLGIYAYPAFLGQYISPRMRVTIPQSYFDLFAYLEKQDKNKRIMNLPQGSYWGWYEYSWGLRGSGFIWYGIEQPIMDRAFDVWSDELEGYYWELSNALRMDDTQKFNQIIDKYHISYILYDESLIHSDPFNPMKLAYKQTDLLKGNDHVSFVKQFGSVSLYQTTTVSPSTQNISLANHLPNILNPERFEINDLAFQKNGIYQTDQTKPYDVIYPFGSLFTNRFARDSAFVVEESSTSFKITTSLQPGEYNLHMPSFVSNNQLIPVNVYAQKQDNTVTLSVETDLPTVRLETKKIDTVMLQKQFQFDAETGDSFLVSINSNDTFEIGNDLKTNRLIGTALLHADNLENTIRVYSVAGSTVLPLAVSNFVQPHICGPIRGDAISKSDKFGDSLTLEAQNTSICQVYPQALTYDQPALVNIRMDYKSESDEFPSFCFYSENMNKCTNHKDRSTYGFSNTKFSPYSDYFEFYPIKPDTIYPQLVLEALRDEDRDQVKKISYKNIHIVSYPLVHEFLVDFSSELEDSAQESRISVQTPIRITVEFSKQSGAYSNTDLLKKNLYKKTPFTYGSFLDGSYNLEEETDGTIKKIILTAQHASSYLLLQGPSLPLQYGYILSIANKNNAGLPLTLNVFSNKELRNYTYTNYSAQTNADHGYYVLPPAYNFDTGISVLMGTTSYTDDESKNTLSDFDIYPIPYDYLTNIFLEDSSTKMGHPTITAPQKVVKRNYYSYQVEVGAEQEEIILFQSYHPGWKVYESSCNWSEVSCKLKNTLPFLFGKEIKEHVLINNWANGWKIPMSDSQSPTTYVVIFWPQYLQFAGFGLFFGSILFTTAIKFKTKNAKIIFPALGRSFFLRNKHLRNVRKTHSGPR